jgi:predicted ATPase
MPAALARHDRILEDAVAGHGGRVFSRSGDGLAAAFATAADALSAAVAAQQGLIDESWDASGPLRVRMGVHSGAADERHGDYLGPTLNRAARLMAAAHGGQVVCSLATAELAGVAMSEDVGLVDLGEHRLRDLARAEHVFQVTHPTLPSQIKPLRSLDAYPSNLPIQISAFIGRERQLEKVNAALGESRIVTLTGVGGVGKTRLAVQSAADLLPQYRDGAWLVELAAAVDPDDLVEVTAAALDVPERQGQSLSATLTDFLRAKRVLLVLDNCEHLLDAVASFVEGVVSRCPHVAVLATSREGLGVDGERILAVPSLGVPEDNSDPPAVSDAAAVRLFVERASEAKAGFTVSEANASAVARLVRRLDGIPLAIELAAARVRSLTPAELAERLDERFSLLAGGRRTAVERHQTLRRAIDWSYELLSEPERRAFNRLAVFATDFPLSAAEAVIAGDGVESSTVVDLLGHLVDKSLVVAEESGDVTR